MTEVGELAGRPEQAPVRRTTLTLAVAVVLALIVGTGLGWVLFSPRHPGDSSADAGFARDMHDHHGQAVEMSLLAIERAESEQIVSLATDIATSQSGQMGRMEAWLTAWGLSQAHADPADRMTWMADHPAGAGHDDLPDGVLMPGMATPEEMQALRDASGTDAEILFLQLMITHHLAGVDMAQAAVDLAADSEVVRLASAMVNGQTMEIDLMVDFLSQRDAEPRESPEELQPGAPTEDEHDH